MQKKMSKVVGEEFLALADVKLKSYEEDGFSALSIQQALMIYHNLLYALDSIIDEDMEDDALVSEDSLIKSYIDAVLLTVAEQVKGLSNVSEPTSLKECNNLKNAFHRITDVILPTVSFAMKYYKTNLTSKMSMIKNIGAVDISQKEESVILYKKGELSLHAEHSMLIYALIIDYTHVINNMFDVIHSVLYSDDFLTIIKETVDFYKRMDYSVNEYISDAGFFKMDKLDARFNFLDFMEKASEIRKKNKQNV